MQSANETHIVNSWLADLSHQIGVPLVLNEEKVCAIGHVSGLDCIVEAPEAQGLILLRAALMPWPPQTPISAEQLLTDCFLGLKTGGAAFAIDAEERELVMWMSRRLAALDADSFMVLIAEFLDHATNWRDALLSGRSAAPPTPI